MAPQSQVKHSTTEPLRSHNGTPLTGTLANSEDPDEMQHHAAFHQGLHCLLRLKQRSKSEIHHYLKNPTCDPLKYTMGSPILIVSREQGKIHPNTKVKHKLKINLFLNQNICFEYSKEPKHSVNP